MTGRSTSELVDHLFREKAGQMVASLTRVLGTARLDLAEEVVQEALLAALRSWPFDGVPTNPGGWLFRTAKNRAIDRVRHEAMAREKISQVVHELSVLPDRDSDASLAGEVVDDQLAMMLMCCHPALPREARIALTLKTVGGFSVDEIASAFLAKRQTIQQRIVRAKRQLRDDGIELRLPPEEELRGRVEVVLDVLYLMFNEGYHASEGEAEVREDLCAEAIRLTSLVVGHRSASSPKAVALLSLMQLHASRLPARATAGELTLLSMQDRTLWDRRMIAEGLSNLGASATGEEISAYHVEAAIAACHAVAPAWGDTDWGRLVELYDDLYELKPTAVVRINRAIALSKLEGPAAALEELEAIETDGAIEDYLPFHAALGELREATGDRDRAEASFRRAAELAKTTVVRQHFLSRLGG